MRLMQLVGLRHLLPKSVRARLLHPWNRLLELEQLAAERRFYRQFVRPGDLVFDIGANRGGKCAPFLRLGARVVAVEPNPDCVRSLLKRFPREIESGQLTVLSAAVGRSAGSVLLRQFSLDGCNGSVSDVFAAAMELESGSPTAVFTVEMIAGASLFKRFGMPTFVKIDVEGMDAEVLSTVPRRPRMLSFEFNLSTYCSPMIKTCLGEVARLGFTEANFTELAVPSLLLREWVTPDRVLDEITRTANGGALWGDIIVR